MVLRAVSPAGRAVAVVGVAAWFGGWRLGWEELQLVAGGCLVAIVIAVLFTIGRSSLEVGIDLEPQRVTVGESAVGRVRASNTGARRVLGLRLEARVGTGWASFDMPSLGAGGSWDDIFVIETTRRCIMAVGPLTSVREDPLGLARRSVAWADALELYVHPKITRLAGITAGWMRDLEGRPTNDLSPSDVAFHTLREYVPGDDRRHIHWRTSARLGALSGRPDHLMVRQYVDTRRSHLGLVLSTNEADYANEDEFELAVSLIGSLGVSALLDEQTVTVTTGARPLPAYSPTKLLDGLSGLDRTRTRADVSMLVKRSIPLVRGASIVSIVAGSPVAPRLLRSAAERFHHDVRVLAVRAVPGADATMQTIGSTTILQIGSLDDLPRVLMATVAR